jgi:hypothetical protein
MCLLKPLRALAGGGTRIYTHRVSIHPYIIINEKKKKERERGLVGCLGTRGRRRSLTLGSTEMQHVSVFPKHVDFLHTRDRLHVQLLQRTLKLLIILRVCRFRFSDDFSSHGTLTAYPQTTKTDVRPQQRCKKKKKREHLDSPILFAAACDCSLASFARSTGDVIVWGSSVTLALSVCLSVGYSKNKVRAQDQISANKDATVIESLYQLLIFIRNDRFGIFHQACATRRCSRLFNISMLC